MSDTMTKTELREVIDRAEGAVVPEDAVVYATRLELPDGVSGVRGEVIAEHPVDGQVRQFTLRQVRKILEGMDAKTEGAKASAAK
jgi:hypothetical protein